MKPDVLLVPVLWPSVPVQLYIYVTMLKPRLQPEKSYLKDIILIPCIIAYHRTAKKKLTKWISIVDYAAKGIDKDKFVKVCSVMNHCGTKVMHLPLIWSIL
ncbi:hypothetical protein NXX24_21125 [Bacteroides fragilis]|nr:hypothetical protein [Bacteroides fragilis]